MHTLACSAHFIRERVRSPAQILERAERREIYLYVLCLYFTKPKR
jgi:ppGpp synthetase/RelA/SpoT-type nucleotidyltranferase